MKSDSEWLKEAIELSKRCPLTERSFAVGAVLVSKSGALISSGYSLELGEGTHAEQNAISKALELNQNLEGATIYCSLEPCSLRLSGKKTCVSRILEAKFSKLVYALKEPPIFVKCEGAELLSKQGLQVLQLAEFGALVEAINSHLIRK